jgi:hypothetical protein
MVNVIGRRERRSKREHAARVAAAAVQYARQGWSVCRGAQPARVGGRSCSCDRLGCPAPAAHPLSAAWAMEASAEPTAVERWWSAAPEANIILPTGRTFDVIDVPAGLGVWAMEQAQARGLALGPVAALAQDRFHFFVATRGAPDDENEWWSCRLDCVPETIEDNPGLRWHCRDSYVPAPPSVLPSGGSVTWVRSPVEHPSAQVLPDPIVLLDLLTEG